MTPNLIHERRFVFFRSARVILHDNLLSKLLKNKKYSYIIGISHSMFSTHNSVVVKKKKTSIVNLKKSPEDILQSFHDTTRNEIRRTMKGSGFLFTKDDGNFLSAYSLYRTFRKAKCLNIKSKKFLQQAMRFSAYYNDNLIAVITCYDTGKELRIQNIWSLLTPDKDLRKIVGYATRRLIYDICVYGAKNGRTYLDLASINTDNKKKEGITAFKLSFGGDIIDEYTYTYRSAIIRFLSDLRAVIRNTI